MNDKIYAVWVSEYSDAYIAAIYFNKQVADTHKRILNAVFPSTDATWIEYDVLHDIKIDDYTINGLLKIIETSKGKSDE